MSPAPVQNIRTDAAHLFALCGFAIAQPLLDLLGDNPTFFVAHDLDGTDVAVFVTALVVVPPLALLTLLATLRLVAPPAARITRAVVTGLLIALTLTPPLARGIGFSTTAWIIVTALLGMGATLAYDRLHHLRTFVTYLTPAPVLFVLVFALLTPAHTLLFGADPAAAAVDLQGTRTPIVVVAFDEFPLGVLLDDDGAIDGTRFPGFARLESISTWYPNATTVSVQTLEAVPAIETGLVPVDQTVPIAASYPRSLFTLFARSHDLHVTEAVTRVCPRDLCRSRARADTGDTFESDLRTVYLRTLLPASTATDWGVPAISDRWSGFDEEATNTEIETPRNAPTTADFDERVFAAADDQDQAARFGTFLDSLRAGDTPGLWFHHALLPHVPYARLADGRPYNARYVPESSFTQYEDAELVHVDAQRLVLQTKYTDGLITELLHRLEESQLLADAMVVVVADHGVSLVPGESRRSLASVDARNGMLPVPLFVKYPGQSGGTVDERDARTIDVVPTIADALGVDLPGQWRFDGRSLASPPAPRPRRQVVGTETFSEPADAEAFARALRAVVVPTGDEHDGFRLAPFGGLVGQAVAGLPQASGTVGRVELDNAGAYGAIDLDGVLPVIFEATVTGVEPDQWVAVALNGVVAGVGPTYELDGATRLVVMLDPAFMRAGANTLDLLLVDDNGTLRPLRHAP